MIRKDQATALVAEFLGTMLLVMTVLAVSTSQIGIGYFTAIGVGLLLALMVFAIGNISGAVLNPALSIGLWTIRKLSSMRTIAYIVVQLLGGYVAFLLFQYLSKSGDYGWTIPDGDFSGQVLVAEVVGTAIFAFGLAAAIYQKMEGTAKALAIGGALAVGVMVASIASAGLLNPAVAVGAQLWVWATYILGPVLGAIIGFNLYNLLYAANSAPAKRSAAKATAKKK